MTRNTLKLCIALACGLLAAVAYRALWAEAPPPVRTVSPEVFLKAKQEGILKNQKWESQRLIDETQKLLFDRAANISDFFRGDAMTFIDPLRAVLQTDNVEDIKASTIALQEKIKSLFDSIMWIEKVNTFLVGFGSDLVPSLRTQVEGAVLSVQQAMKGQKWDTLRDATNDLSGWYEHRLLLVKDLHMILEHVNGLGVGVNPKLRQEMDAAVKPLQQALNAGSWDQFEEQWRQRAKFVHYPSAIANHKEQGKRKLEMLPPSEQGDIRSAIAAADRALQGESWEEALSQAKAIEEAINKSVERRLPFELKGSPCVRILAIDGGGIRGVIPAMVLAELERLTNTPIAKLFDYIVGTSTGGIIALGVAAPDPENPQKYSLKVRWERSAAIFGQSIVPKVSSGS